MAVANRLAPRTQKDGLTAYLTQDAVKDQINKVVGGKNGTRFIPVSYQRYRQHRPFRNAQIPVSCQRHFWESH